MYQIFLIHSSVNGYLGCFHVLVVVNSASMNIGVHVPIRMTVLSWYMPWSGVARSYGNFIFDFLRNFHTVFHSGCTNLHSHWQCIKIPFSSHPFQHLLFVDILKTAILTGMKLHLVVDLICISLIISDVGHFFMCLLAICMSSLGKCLLRCSTHFASGLFVFCYCCMIFHIFWKLSPCQSHHL